MENQIYERFKALAEKKRLTADEKAEIKAKAEEMSITMKKNCPNCYHDAAVLIALALKPEEPKAEPAEGEYELYPDVDIALESYKYGRMHICAKECTPANARKWRKAGLSLRFFKRYPHADNE